MTTRWEPQTALGIINTQIPGLSCIATVIREDRRCLKSLSQSDRYKIISKINKIPENAPANPAREATTLGRIARLSLCNCHKNDTNVAKAVQKWQQALAVGRSALGITLGLQSVGISGFEIPNSIATYRLNSPRHGTGIYSDSDDGDSNDGDSDDGDWNNGDSDDGDSDDGDSDDGDILQSGDTTITTISTSSKTPREELARVIPEGPLRENSEQTMLDEFHQQLTQATHQAEVEDLRRRLNNATLERDQFALDIERLKDENQRA